MSGLTSQQDELVLLRKRARRRLIGAIVMSLVASGVMLRVLDSKPQHEMRPETVDIVSNLPSDSKPATKPAVPAGEASTTPAAGAQASAKPDSAPAVAPEAAASANAAPASAAAPAASLPAAPPPAPALVAAMPAPPPAKSVAAVSPPSPAKETPPPAPKPAPRPEPAKPEPVKAETVAKPEKPAEKPNKKESQDPAAILSADASKTKKPEKPEPKPEPKAEKADKVDKKPEKTEKLEKPVAKPEEKPAGKEGKQRYLIQLAALSDPAKADALKQKLAGLGVHASVSRAETSKGEIHRVRVGPFASQEEAKAVMNKLGAAGVSGIMVPQ